ncbi:WG repeat-containing protein [Lachnospiraceae bacterium 56-18]
MRKKSLFGILLCLCFMLHGCGSDNSSNSHDTLTDDANANAQETQQHESNRNSEQSSSNSELKIDKSINNHVSTADDNDGKQLKDETIDLFPYCENVDGENLYGFMDVSGKTIIKPCFSDVGNFYDNKFCPVSQDGRWGIINISGTPVVNFEYSEIATEPSEGFWAVRDYDSREWGFINPESNKSIPCRYSDYGMFSEGIVPVEKNGYWGAIDKEGKVVIDFIYDVMSASLNLFNTDYRPPCFVNGMIGVRVNNAYGIIDSVGNYVIPMANDNYGMNIVIGNTYCARNYNSGSYPYTILYNLDGEEILNTEIGECAGTINDTAFLDGWGNVYALDPQGNIIVDVDKDIYPLLGVSPVNGHKPASRIDSHQFSVLKMRDSIGFDNWTYVELYTAEVSQRYVYNLINDSGALFLDHWYDLISRSESYIAGYDEKSNTTDLYNYDGDLLRQYEGAFTDFAGDDFLVDTKGGKAVYLPEGSVEEYASVSLLDSSAAIIVHDGVFYGVCNNTGYIGKGINYNKISYDPKSHTCTMELGAVTEKYRIGIDGTANLLHSEEP